MHALPKFLEALRELSPDTWRSCLHVSTSPFPSAVGGVDDAILDKGLGPIGEFPLPQDLWDFVVPEFYRNGLRDFNVEESWVDGDRVGTGFPSRWSAWSLHFGGRGSTKCRPTPSPQHVTLS